MRHPAGEGTFPSHPGGPGPRPDLTTEVLRGARCIGRSRSRFKKHGPGMMAGPSFEVVSCQTKSRSGAPGGGRTVRGCVHAFPRRASQACCTGVNFKDAPTGAPLPLYFREGKGKEGVPGASNNTGDDAWLFDN